LSEKEPSKEWKKELKEFGETTEKRFQSLEESLRKIGEMSSTPSPASNQEGSEMPKYQCKNGNCGFYSDDGIEMVLHTLEHMAKPKAEEATPPASRLKHGTTAAEIIDCPDCFGNIQRELDRRGKKIVEKEPEKPVKEEKEKPKKRTLF